MTDLAYLAIYVGIGAVLVFLAGRKGMGGFRRWLDRAANRSASNLAEAKRISMIGEGRAVQTFAGRSQHRLTIGLRGLSTVLVVALVWVVAQRSLGAPGSFIGGDYETEAVLAALALALYYLAFIWSYRLVRQDDELRVPTMFFGHRSFDLRRLIRIEDDDAYMLRLYFDDGRKSEIIKYVEGRAQLTNALEGYTAGNGSAAKGPAAA